jgi:hypothetical protein
MAESRTNGDTQISTAWQNRAGFRSPGCSSFVCQLVIAVVNAVETIRKAPSSH